jgi:hypothetical protein
LLLRWAWRPGVALIDIGQGHALACRLLDGLGEGQTSARSSTLAGVTWSANRWPSVWTARYGQLSGASSLREVVTGLESHAARLYHLGAEPARCSTLADANALRPSAPFAQLFAQMMKHAHRGLRRKLAEAVYLIDSTGLPLNRLSADWARFSARACGAKLHVVYDPDADRPIYAAFSAAKVNDVTVAQAMPIEDGATYVFDLVYYDYAWWAKLDRAGCRIVTRFKSNTPLQSIEELPLTEGGAILSDRIGFLLARQGKNRRNPIGAGARGPRQNRRRQGSALPQQRSGHLRSRNR